MMRTDDQRGELTIGAGAGDRDKAERQYGVLLRGVAMFAEQVERLIAAFANRNDHLAAILELIEQRWPTVIGCAADDNRGEGRRLGPTQVAVTVPREIVGGASRVRRIARLSPGLKLQKPGIRRRP